MLSSRSWYIPKNHTRKDGTYQRISATYVSFLSTLIGTCQCGPHEDGTYQNITREKMVHTKE